MKLIETYKKIEKREMLDCRIKSIKELIRNYGVNLTSYEALIIGESITFMYDKIHIPGVSLERIPYALVSKIFLENIFSVKIIK